MMPVPPAQLPASDLDEVFARTESWWRDLGAERIFLTGGGGFFGSWLAESFCASQDRLGGKAQLWMLCRDPDGWRSRFPHLDGHPSLRLVPGDLAGLRPAGGRFHGVIHAAAATQTPFQLLRTALEGALRVLDFASAGSADRLLFTSSGAVYGPPPASRSPIPEDSGLCPPPEQPATAYGQSKRAVEGLFSAYARETGAAAVLARCFAFAGPRLPLDANFAIGNFIRDALWGDAIRIQGDGTPLRSYLYAADLAAWLWALYFEGPSARPIHVGSDQPVSIRELAETVAAALRPGLPIRIAGQAVPGRLPQCYVPSIARAREGLGLEPWTRLPDAIRRTADWHRAQGGKTG